MFSSVVCPHQQYFSTLSRKRYDFRRKLLNTKCVFGVSLQLLSEAFLILREIQRDMIMHVCKPSYDVPVIFVRFQ